ncbi:MAG: XdhC/CoxI family protein [Syntrophobacteraceae bacterium]|nr:XdhC/CoxI family protein [Syntrophobacteraceae bacterium]
MEILREQLKARRAGISYAVLTVAETEGASPFKVGKKMLLLEDGTTFGTIGGGRMECQAIEDAARAIRDKESFFKRYVHTPDYEEPGLGCSFKVSLFVEVAAPEPRLVVCGAGHVGGAVLRLAKFLKFTTILIDNRGPELIGKAVETADHFIRCQTPEEAIIKERIPDGAYYLCCAPTHTQDKSALKGALQKNFTYVGMLGSAKKSKEMFRQLEDEGISKDLLMQVHTPVGLDICDMSPEEVAFSVLAEILMIKNGCTGRPRKELAQSYEQKNKLER